MAEKELEMFKSRQLFLKGGDKSGYVVLADPVGGDIYLSFQLNYIPANSNGETHLTPTDKSHADIVIDTPKGGITKPQHPLLIGTYGKRALYLSFVVQPLNSQSEEHEITVMFYRGEEVNNG